MSVPYEMLLHPELLSNETLIQVIEERHLRIPNLSNMPRPELLQVFHQYCVPYGQRRYRDSGRGKLLNKGRQISPENVRTAVCDNNINTSSCFRAIRSENNQSRAFLHKNEDRLKLAPDMLSSQIKRIKLDRSTTNQSSMKRKPSNDPINIASDGPPPKKGRKPITWP